MSPPGRVLVTGAAGFIGSTLVERLLAEGRDVVGLDSFDPFYPEPAKRRNLARTLRCSRFRLVQADLRDADALEATFAEGGFDAVVHLAALAGVGPSLSRPAEYADVNVRGTAGLLEAGVRHGGPRVLFASSSSVYGARGDGPFRETDPADHPISPYAATKRAGELVAHAFHHAHGIPITCARIFTAYGPRQRPDLAIRVFAERLRRGEPLPVYGDGSSRRDFTYVDDLVGGLVSALDAETGWAVFNFGAGREVTLREVIEALGRLLDVTPEIEWLPPRPGDVPRTWADITAAREALGYAPATTLEEGLGRFVRWLEDPQ